MTSKIKLTYLMIAGLLMAGCVNQHNSSQTNTDSTTVGTNVFDALSPGKNKTYPLTLESFTPTRFDKDSFITKSTEALGEGVKHIVYEFNLTSGKNVEADAIEVDLTKAKIDTHHANGVATPNKQMEDYEKKHPNKVMAVLNADFFATGVGGSSVNAYVDSNLIIKAGHNDTGIYDYTNLEADIPASNPMLLGLSGQEAKIGASLEEGSKEKIIKAKFKNIVTYLSDNKENDVLDGVYMDAAALASGMKADIITENMSVNVPLNAQIAKIKKDSKTPTLTSGTIEKCLLQKADGKKTFTDVNEESFYIIFSAEANFQGKAGSRIGYSIDSDDHYWKYYDTLIGGRQSLVENGNIAPTVTLENTNGAQVTGIPRSGVGVKNSSTLVVVAIEGLRYKASNVVTPQDPYGVNLPEFAEFMRYIGCYDAMNFDGGGSTMMITKNNNGQGEKTIQVRSSDYGTAGLDDARKVYNTILVTTK